MTIATVEQRQFFATKKRLVWFETIELYHPDLGILRYVLNQKFDKQFTLEADAPRNPSETVTFNPVAANTTDPELTSGVLTRSFQFERVGTEIKEKQKSIDADTGGYIKQLEVVYRQYINNTTAPANNVEYLFGGVSIVGDRINLTASDDQPSSVNVAIIQNIQNLPGLKGVV